MILKIECAIRQRGGQITHMATLSGPSLMHRWQTIHKKLSQTIMIGRIYRVVIV